MRKAVSVFLVVLCLLCLVGFGVWTAVCIDDYQAFLAIPNKSGLDYWMVGQIYATGFLLLSSVGIPAGILSLKFCHMRWERICGAVTLAASSIFLGVGICLWVFWP
jgi:hypothetical protein